MGILLFKILINLFDSTKRLICFWNCAINYRNRSLTILIISIFNDWPAVSTFSWYIILMTSVTSPIAWFYPAINKYVYFFHSTIDPYILPPTSTISLVISVHNSLLAKRYSWLFIIFTCYYLFPHRLLELKRLISSSSYLCSK